MTVMQERLIQIAKTMPKELYETRNSMKIVMALEKKYLEIYGDEGTNEKK